MQLNDTNGGSFEVMLGKACVPSKTPYRATDVLLAKEEKMGLSEDAPYGAFKRQPHRHELRKVVDKINKDGKKIVGYGASTKGNVILQFCGLGPKEIPFIAEVNQDKFGSFTPGTLIPIISEEEARGLKPDYMMVLPWHFKRNIIGREGAYLQSGGKLLFPLPRIEIV